VDGGGRGQLFKERTEQINARMFLMKNGKSYVLYEQNISLVFVYFCQEKNEASPRKFFFP